MRTPLEKNIDSPLSSITVLDLKEPYFDPNWHFHPHYQLFIVLEGEGTRLIGDSIQHFEKGDTVLLGPNLPHLWRNDKSYFEPNSELSTRGIVVYFTQEFLDNTLSNLPESIRLNKLFSKSYRGIEFTGNTRTQVKEALINLSQTDGFDAILKLLSLLNLLSKSKEIAFIASLGYTNTHKKSETQRMHNVYEYAMKHFKESIKLEDIANLANMTVPAFCRYFKKRSNKTFSDFISEIRIGHACKMLENEKYSVSEVCYESGFNTLSNFNKKFKEVTGKTPSQFKKELVGK